MGAGHVQKNVCVCARLLRLADARLAAHGVAEERAFEVLVPISAIADGSISASPAACLSRGYGRAGDAEIEPI